MNNPKKAVDNLLEKLLETYPLKRQLELDKEIAKAQRELNQAFKKLLNKTNPPEPQTDK